jgi:hypothetical protein
MLPMFPDIPKCPKCGSTNIRPIFQSTTNIVILTCGCGYQWRTLPLDYNDYPEKPSAQRPAPKKG